MNIKKSNKDMYVSFATINQGDIFKQKRTEGMVYFMKIFPLCNSEHTAVDISTGIPAIFYAEDQVIPVLGSFVEEGELIES